MLSAPEARPPLAGLCRLLSLCLGCAALLSGQLAAQSPLTGGFSKGRLQPKQGQPAPNDLDPAFVNFETPHVHPLELAPDGQTLLAVNTADNRLEVFDVSPLPLTHLASIPVGLEPVTVRALDSDTVWVVNQVSDSISIVDLDTNTVVATVFTDDEPADVVFAGQPIRAYVSCSQANTVLVFNPSNLSAAPVRIELDGEDPRALAVSTNGKRVYVGIFESGNGTTILGGGSTEGGGFPQNAVSHVSGPYAGVNPPPNDGANITPSMTPGLPLPPAVGLIVKQDPSSGDWLDENGGDWTKLTSGPDARLSGRQVGWQLRDHDVAVIRTQNLTVTYVDQLMNIVMALGVNPASGVLSIVGTEATNHIRYEPNLNGTFVRVLGARYFPSSGNRQTFDLNPHLDYSTSTLPQSERDKSLGDPRQILWNSNGQRAYVAGMGSNNVVVLNAFGNRAGLNGAIEVGDGPTGLALHGGLNRLFVLNKFDASISTVNLANELQEDVRGFYDPTPAAVRLGRPFLYSTHDSSGLGQVSCGSCHVDARMDRLAWDLGNPTGDISPVAGQNQGMNNPDLAQGIADFHPMKGPMTTQTLQDIVGKEPFHWRGDKNGLEDFNGAYTSLQGDDAMLSPAEMQRFEHFLASLSFPPNPFRNMDNSLRTDIDLSGLFTTGKFLPEGQPLPPGDAQRGRQRFVGPNGLVGGQFDCITCHTAPTGLGSNSIDVGGFLELLPAGPNGEKHHALVGIDGNTNTTMKIPHLRNLHEKVGMNMATTESFAGFGFLHDGSVDSIARFLSKPSFGFTSDQDIADMTAFLLSFSGGGIDLGDLDNPMKPLGPPSQDAHAGVGQQITLSAWPPTAGEAQRAQDMVNLAEAGALGLTVRGVHDGHMRGWTYLAGGIAQSDRRSERLPFLTLLAQVSQGGTRTLTLVPKGSETRIALDRDTDGAYDQDELDAGSSPADPQDTPGGPLGTVTPTSKQPKTP